VTGGNADHHTTAELGRKDFMVTPPRSSRSLSLEGTKQANAPKGDSAKNNNLRAVIKGSSKSESE
jgi:hypothetical protein